jgi:hypothetical protein
VRCRRRRNRGRCRSWRRWRRRNRRFSHQWRSCGPRGRNRFLLLRNCL